MRAGVTLVGTLACLMDTRLVQVIVLIERVIDRRSSDSRACMRGRLVRDGWLGGRSRLVDALARLSDAGLVQAGVTLVGTLACLDTGLVHGGGVGVGIFVW